MGNPRPQPVVVDHMSGASLSVFPQRIGRVALLYVTWEYVVESAWTLEHGWYGDNVLATLEHTTRISVVEHEKWHRLTDTVWYYVDWGSREVAAALFGIADRVPRSLKGLVPTSSPTRLVAHAEAELADVIKGCYNTTKPISRY